MKHVGIETPMRNGIIEDKNILMLIREANTIENELDKAKDKFPS